MFKCFSKCSLANLIIKNNLSILISSPILKRNGAHLIGKRMFVKNKSIVHNCLEHAKELLKHHQFASSFEQ